VREREEGGKGERRRGERGKEIERAFS